MTERLRLITSDPRVWRRTLDAQQPNATKPARVKVLCGACQGLLGNGWGTVHGPLFTSSWEVELPLTFRVVRDGKVLDRREAIRYLESRMGPAERSGSPIRDTVRQRGTWALLDLPPDFPQDYPALMVRCLEHGDAVLDRSTVVAAIEQAAKRRTVGRMKVDVAFPRLDYDDSAPPDIGEHPLLINSQSSETRPWQPVQA